MKIDIGELINSSYKPEEVIDYLNTSLTSLTKALLEAQVKQNWAEVGTISAQLSLLAATARVLANDMNGGKKGSVV